MGKYSRSLNPVSFLVAITPVYNTSFETVELFGWAWN
jgi:hypothetical protein